MIIACDFDDVLNNLSERVIELYNAQSGKNIQISNITAYNFYDCLDKDDAGGMIKLFKNKLLWDSLTPIPGATDGLQKLIDFGYRVYIVTATAPENFVWKVEWLKRHFPFFNSDNVVRLKDKSLFKCDIMIDDCLDNVLKNKLCHKIVFDYPWNRNEAKDFVYNIHRCTSWSEILDAINKIEEEIKNYE